MAFHILVPILTQRREMTRLERNDLGTGAVRAFGNSQSVVDSAHLAMIAARRLTTLPTTDAAAEARSPPPVR